MADPILYTFVDNSNVLIEGRRCAQMKRSRRSRRNQYKDDSYSIDWGRFLYLLYEQDSRGLADIPILYGSRPPNEDSIWNRIREDGFDVRLFDRNIRNKEKGVDVEMALDIAKLIYGTAKPGIVVIAAGDADYVPAAQRAVEMGWPVEVWFWENVAGELKEAASRFCELDEHLEFLRLGGKIWQ